MPKSATSHRSKLTAYVKEFGSNVFSTDGTVLLCRPCNKNVSTDQRSQVLQHVATAKHLQAMKRHGPTQTVLHTSTGQELPQSQGKESQFYADMCNAFIAADIPFNKLTNPVFREFLTKYTKEHIPDESTIRKNYLPKSYETTLNRIRETVGDKNIWVSIDESRDAMNRAVGNVVVGTLEGDFCGETFLLHSEVLQSTNHSTIARLFDAAMKILWPSGIKYENILLFVSDGAPYMVKAATGLQVLYPKMLHVTCLAHGLHRVAEEVRAQFKHVDSLIANVKKVFVKAPTRINKFQEIAPNLALPPNPVITRWGTWLEAAQYYAENFETVKDIVQQFDPDDAAAILIAQEEFETPGLPQQLAHIRANFGFLTAAIQRLERKNLSIMESVKIIEDVRAKLQLGSSATEKRVCTKFEAVLKKNSGYNEIRIISRILNGENVDMRNLQASFTVKEFAALKYAPITSCEIERSFSRYKSLLRDNRQNFDFENLKMVFVTHCNL